MKTKLSISFTTIVLCVTVLIGALLPAGCGGTGKPKVMVFLGKSSKSYDTMKPAVDNLKKKYKDKVTFVIVDYDNPDNKGEINKYHVSMNPTVLVFNTQGQIKETFMGAAREDMLAASIEGFLPRKQTTTSSQPGSTSSPVTNSPVTPLPSGSTPMSVP
jgi:hypothetical protein